MTYYAQKKNTNGVSLLAYFDTYSGKPMTNYPYTIRIDIKRFAEGQDTFYVSLVYQNKYTSYVDTLFVSHIEHREDIERRILRIARSALYEKRNISKDNLEKIYNPRRDFRVRKLYSNESVMENPSDSDIASYAHPLISEE